jgi:hypothetical protein
MAEQPVNWTSPATKAVAEGVTASGGTNHDMLGETVALIRSLGLQVRSADELGAVLKQLMLVRTPETARGRVGLLTTVLVACVSFSMAALTSIFLLTGDWMAPAGREAPAYCLGGLGIVWGVTGLVVLGTVLACFGGAPPQPPKAPPATPSWTTSG